MPLDGLVIAGGDGTLMRVLSAWRRSAGTTRLPPLVLLPLGTVNTIAKSWNGALGPWEILRRYFAGAGALSARPSLDIGIDDEAYVAATFGSGLISHFFEEYAGHRRRGLGLAATIFIRTFVGSFVQDDYAMRLLAPVRGVLCFDGEVAAFEQFTLLITSVLKNVGLGLQPAYLAGSVEHQIHLIATDLDARRLGPQAWRILLGKPLIAPHLVDRLVTEFTVRFSVPTSVVLDGEAIVARTVRVRAGDDLLVFTPG